MKSLQKLIGLKEKVLQQVEIAFDSTKEISLKFIRKKMTMELG